VRYDPNKHHRRSIRLKGYDYSRAGAYFLTMVTQGRECMFGQVVDGAMQLNRAGQMVTNAWTDLPARFPFVTVDEFVVMPNHLHAIIILTDRPEPHRGRRGESHAGELRRGESCIRPDADARIRPNGVGDHADGPYDRGPDGMGDHRDGPNKDRPYDRGPNRQRSHGTLPQTVGRVVQAFKSVTTHEYTIGVRERGWTPFPRRLWQRNYHDRIIRNEDEMNRIRQYIVDNPLKWDLDRENPTNQ